jgi:hypothetical protein
VKRVLAALAMLALAGCRAAPSAAAKDAPELYVLTSLPLLFDEGFSLGPAKGEAAVFLRQHYRLKPIDVPSQLPDGAVLLAAQPRALPAEELVALDAWVRRGGKLLLLADPMLEWPSDRPLGDRLRPPVQYADTGLLLHWGLRLDAPDERGLRHTPGEMGSVDSLSPGRLVKVGGQCSTDPEGIAAHCNLGRGQVHVVADADWLNVAAVRGVGGNPGDNLVILQLLLSGLSGRFK